MTFFHDKKHNVLVYENRSPFVLQNLPDAKLIGRTHFAVPFTLQNAQVLRYFNYLVPEFVTDQNYDFPIEPGRSPLPHQKIYTNFQVLHPRCFNLGDPGTMKTLSTLWAVDFIMQQYPKGECRALVIAPLTILETVWAAAIFKNFLSRRTFEVLTGSAERRQQLLAKKADISIINFDGVGIGAHTRKKFELDGLSKDILDREDIKIIVVDEASAYRDAQTKRSRIARLNIGKRRYLFMLTGTPLPNAPTDAYGLAKMMNNSFGKSFQTFQSETMMKVSQFKFVPQRDGYEKARKLLVPAVRFALSDVWNGPPMTVQKRMVPLTEQQKKLMLDLKRDLQIVIKGNAPINVGNEAAARWKFIQISLGAIYEGDSSSRCTHLIDAGPRYAEVESIVESTERKVVIFVPLTGVIDALRKSLSKRWKVGVINGNIPLKERTATIRAFESDENLKAVIVDPGATAHGINEFVVADTAIWMGAIDKTELWIQGNKRIHRPGQKYPTTVFQIVSNKLEEEMFRRLETNTSMQGMMLEAVRRGDI